MIIPIIVSAVVMLLLLAFALCRIAAQSDNKRKW